MADLSIGSDSVSGELFGDLSYNRLKNHWRQADPITALTDPQPGMICSDSDDNKLHHYQAADWFEIVQGNTPIGDNIAVIWGDNSDGSIRYDEATNDALLFGIPLAGRRGLVILDQADAATADITALLATVTDTRLALVDADLDSFLSFSFLADDRPGIVFNSAGYMTAIHFTQAEGLAGADLRFGVNEELRNMLICDRGDLTVDFGTTIQAEPTLWFRSADANVGKYTRINWQVYYTLGGPLNIRAGNDYLLLETASSIYLRARTSMASGDFLVVDSGAGIEFTDTNAEQAWVYIEPEINQTLTAAYVGLLMDVTETGTGDGSAGSGYNALMALRVGGDDRFVIENDGTVRFPEVGAGATRWSEMKQSTAEGIATSSDLRIGLDPSLRSLRLMDLTDIDSDCGLTAMTEASLFWHRRGAVTIYTYMNYAVFLTNSEFGFTGRAFDWVMQWSLAAGHFMDIKSAGGKQLTDTNAEQAWLRLAPDINQTLTANYVGILLDVTESGLGAGPNELIALRVGGADRFTISNIGEATFYDEMIYVIDSQAVSDPPTDAELDAIYTSPAAVGAGWWTFLENTTSGSGVIYILMSTGTTWEFVALTTAV